jgi:KipI family sensor histidine kinase inhibitor
VCYDPASISFRRLTGKLRRLVGGKGQAAKVSKRVWEIPVCYGGAYGEDLEFVASNAGLSPEEVIAIHSGVDYRLYMLGFLPGFPYLGGLDKRIHTPRLKTPRTKILPGSVGIGGEQTGIYPMPSPGGWQLIGMTPVKLYDPQREQPILYEAGDFLRFVPIDEARFEEIRDQVASGEYQLRMMEVGDS